MALSDDAEAAPAGLAAQGRRGRDAAAVHEPLEDAPDHRDGDRNALAAQEHGELALAPHRVLGPQLLNGLHEGGRAGGPAQPVRPAAPRLEPLAPAIQGGPGNPDSAGPPPRPRARSPGRAASVRSRLA